MTSPIPPSSSSSPSTSSSNDEAAPILEFVAEAEPTAGVVDPSDAAFENDTPKDLAEYEDRYVAFVDILGFKQLIGDSARNAQKLARVVSALDVGFTTRVHSVVLEELSVDEAQVDVRVYTFSDFVVVSTRPTAAGLSTLLYVIWVLASKWVSSGILCRGGITRGKLLHRVNSGSPPMAFGPAFIEAYVLESSTADFPRVMLGRAARDDWERYKADGVLGARLPLLVQKCSDGPSCIDTFCHLKSNGFTLVLTENPIEAEQIQAALESHLDDTAESPAVHRKAKWLAEKFNAAVKDTRYAHLKVRLGD